MSGGIPGSNEHRIRNLEREVRELRRLLLLRSISQAPINPVARKVQIPTQGIAARDGNKITFAHCELIWTNEDDELYFPDREPELYGNILFNDLLPDGDRIAIAVKHDDGRWYIHGYDCEDESDGTNIERLEPNDPTDPGGGPI